MRDGDEGSWGASVRLKRMRTRMRGQRGTARIGGWRDRSRPDVCVSRSCLSCDANRISGALVPFKGERHSQLVGIQFRWQGIIGRIRRDHEQTRVDRPHGMRMARDGTKHELAHPGNNLPSTTTT